MGLKDLFWFEPPPDHGMLYLIFLWDAFSKTVLIFTIPLGKCVLLPLHLRG